MIKFLPFCAIFLFGKLTTSGQGLSPGELWQAKTLYDTTRTAYPNERIQRFLFTANNSEFSQLTISQKINMKSGEIYLSYNIEAANLEMDTLSRYKVREYKNECVTYIAED